jgi:hypothetical protein
MTVQEFVNIDKDLQTKQDIYDVGTSRSLLTRDSSSSSSFVGLLEDLM